ncbi:MAG: lysophospholipid acyltransferase family protein [Woeseia sp.]
MKDARTFNLEEDASFRGRLANVVFGLYAWAVFLPCFSAAVLFALLVPDICRRRRWISGAARVWLNACGIRSRITGIENIPPGHCVVVANHASYLDGLILQAFLPPRFSFVVKGEVQKVPLIHFFLRRIGTRFVDRFVTVASSRDARNLLKAAAAGESLAFFPEGTFHPGEGLHLFRPGAFAAALKGALPVVPVAICGSRQVLPAERKLPSHGSLHIDILQPIRPGDPAFCNSRALAETARQHILAVLDEPDLAAQHRSGRPA